MAKTPEEIKEYKRQWHQQNKARLNEKSRQYQLDHKEEIRVQKSKYREENRVIINAKQNARNALHPEENSARADKYYWDHREEILAKDKLKPPADPKYTKAWKRRNEAKVQANIAYSSARRGHRIAPVTFCLACGDTENLCAHHFSYDPDHRLHVIGLCRRCHKAVHRGELFPEVEARIAQFLEDARLLALSNPEAP